MARSPWPCCRRGWWRRSRVDSVERDLDARRHSGNASHWGGRVARRWIQRRRGRGCGCRCRAWRQRHLLTIANHDERPLPLRGVEDERRGDALVRRHTLQVDVAGAGDDVPGLQAEILIHPAARRHPFDEQPAPVRRILGGPVDRFSIRPLACRTTAPVFSACRYNAIPTAINRASRPNPMRISGLLGIPWDWRPCPRREIQGTSRTGEGHSKA